MLYEKNWNRTKDAKIKAKEYISHRKVIFIPATLRMIMTVLLFITLFLFFDSLAFDYRLRDYAANTTDIIDHMGVITCGILGRIIGDYYLDQVIYEQDIIPFRHYIYRALRIFGYVSIAFIGMITTVYTKAPIIIGYIWFIVAVLTYVAMRMMNFGISDTQLRTFNIWTAIKQTRPKRIKDWRKLLDFHARFLVHEVINIATIGLYGIWLLPYKRTTEKYMLT